MKTTWKEKEGTKERQIQKIVSKTQGLCVDDLKRLAVDIDCGGNYSLASNGHDAGQCGIWTQQITDNHKDENVNPLDPDLLSLKFPLPGLLGGKSRDHSLSEYFDESLDLD